MNKLTICIDFDGVLNNYKGYKEDELYTPRTGAKEFINTLSENYQIVIFTARQIDQVREWLNKYDFKYDNVTNIKIPAGAYIDDRAIRFNGDYAETIKELTNFQAYWEKEPVIEYLECDDMLEEEEICAGDMDYCSNLRTRCKKADDFYFKFENVDLKLTVPKWTGCSYRKCYFDNDGEIISYCHNPSNPGKKLAKMWSPYCMKEECDL